MGDVGTFPFGWIREFRDDNWQIIWDPKTELIIAQGAVSKKVVELGDYEKWIDDKVYDDNVISEPESFLD